MFSIVGGFAVVSKGLTLNTENAMNILFQSAMRGVAAIGQTFVLLTGNIDISIAGVGLFVSSFGAVLMTDQLQWNIAGQVVSPLIAVPLMLLVGMGFGAINGWAVSRIGMHGLIVTLAMWQIGLGAGFIITSMGQNIEGLPRSLDVIGYSTYFGVSPAVIIFFVMVAIAYIVLNYTAFGRAVYATGGSPVSAHLSGINVKRTLFSVFAISGFCIAVGAVLNTARTLSVSMRALTGLELDSIAAVVIGGVSLMGGKGSVIGATIGAIIIGVIDNGMSVLGAQPSSYGIVKGAIIFVAVIIDYVRRRR
jgi:ribose/xylose/arabinose/galactoside ABC-type transport system permease subunit